MKTDLPRSEDKRVYLQDIALLFFLTVLFFYKVIFTDHFLYSNAELISIYLPCLRYIGSCLSAGFFPLWDPYYFFDFVGVSVPGVFYPFNLAVGYLSSFLSLNNSFLLVMADSILHCFMAGAFMYVLLRKFSVRREGALLGGISFAFSGFVIRGVQQIAIIHTLTWFPLAFLFFVKGIEEKYRYSVYAGMALALSFLAGYSVLAFYGCAVLALYALARFFNLIFSDNSRDKSVHVVLAAIITFSLTLGLAAIQLFPMVVYAMSSVRMGAGYDLLVMWGSVPALYFISLIMPHFFGGAGTEHWGQRLVDPVGFWEVSFYTGLCALFFAGLWFPFRCKDRQVRLVRYFLFFLLLFSVFMMMGKYSALFGMCYSLRAFMLSRVPSRWGFFLVFSIAALGGMGFGALSAPLAKNTKNKISHTFKKWMLPYSKWLLVFMLIIAIPLCMKSYWQSMRSILHFILLYALILLFLFLRLRLRYRRRYANLILLVAFIDLFFASERINPMTTEYPAAPPAAYFENNQRLDFLAQDKEIYRVSGLPWPFYQWQPHRVSTLGYLGGFSYKRFADFRGERDPMGSGGHDWLSLRPDPLSQWIDFFNIKYLVSGSDLSASYPQKYEKVAGFSDMYRNRNVFERAFFVSDFKIIKDSQAILEKMERLDLSRTVVLEEDPGFLPDKVGWGAHVRITAYLPVRIELETNAGKNGLLVISDVYYPGWSARVDGKKTKILRANYSFRAIPLAAGAHKVVLTYSSLSLKAGLILFLVTLLILGVLFFRVFPVKRK